MTRLPEVLLPPLCAVTGALASWCFVEHGLAVCLIAAILAPWGCWLMREPEAFVPLTREEEE